MTIIAEIEKITSVTLNGGMEYKPGATFMHRKDYRRWKRKRFFQKLKKIFHK